MHRLIPTLRRNQILLLFCCIVFLLMFRGALTLRVTGDTDDRCYLEWLYILLGQSFPLECYADFYPPGPALVWLPAGVLGLLAGWILPGTIHEWIPVLMGYQSFLCWVAAVFLVDRILRHINLPGFNTPAWTIWFLLSVPILRYVTQRGGMSHAAEVLLVTSIFYFLIVRERFYVALGLTAWLMITRINDSVMLFVVLAYLYDRYRANPQSEKYNKPMKTIGPIVAISAIPLLYIAFIRGHSGVNYLHRLILEIDGHEIARVLFAEWDSLLYTQPWWLFVFVTGLVLFPKLNWFGRTCLGWMGVQLLVCMGWTATGGFLYRYLIGTCFAALFVWVQIYPRLSPKLALGGKITMIGGALYSNLLLWWHGTRLWPIGPSARVGLMTSLWMTPVLVAVSPLPLVVFSVLPPQLAASVPGAPSYQLAGPALWTLLPISLGVLVLAIQLIRTLKNRT